MLKLAATFCAVFLAISALSTAAEARHGGFGGGGGMRMGGFAGPRFGAARFGGARMGFAGPGRMGFAGRRIGMAGPGRVWAGSRAQDIGLVTQPSRGPATTPGRIAPARGWHRHGR